MRTLWEVPARVVPRGGGGTRGRLARSHVEDGTGPHEAKVVLVHLAAVLVSQHGGDQPQRAGPEQRVEGAAALLPPTAERAAPTKQTSL